MRLIDLNSDVGEAYGVWPGGPDDLLVPMLSSVNVACGFHAGDPGTMRRTVELAVAHGCAVGAQVSYPDLAGFGRRFIDMAPADLTDAVIYQIGALEAFAGAQGARVAFVKPHGALYNAIVHHETQAHAVAAAVLRYRPDMPLLGLPGSVLEAVCAHDGVAFVAEGFADRAYTDEGTLVPRSQPGALITDTEVAAQQAVRLAGAGVRSMCVHSDTPGAPAILAAVADALRVAGFTRSSFVS